jgi:hypothetical protein
MDTKKLLTYGGVGAVCLVVVIGIVVGRVVRGGRIKEVEPEVLEEVMDRLHSAVVTYAEVSYKTVKKLPPNLGVLDTFFGDDSPLQLAAAKGVAREKLHFVGAGISPDAAPTTPVLLYEFETRPDDPPKGAVKLLNGELKICEGDEWLAYLPQRPTADSSPSTE